MKISNVVVFANWVQYFKGIDLFFFHSNIQKNNKLAAVWFQILDLQSLTHLCLKGPRDKAGSVTPILLSLTLTNPILFTDS